MALNWSWSDKVGELTTSDRDGNIYVHNIYSGNAWMIMLYFIFFT